MMNQTKSLLEQADDMIDSAISLMSPDELREFCRQRNKLTCAPDPRIAAAEDMAKALDAFLEAWDKSHPLEKTHAARIKALVSLAAWEALK